MKKHQHVPGDHGSIYCHAEESPNIYCGALPSHEVHCIAEMTPDHERHLDQIMESFLAAVDKKYRAGVKQHGGKLWEKPGLIEKAMEECVDQYVYLFTLQQQRDNPSIVDLKAKDIDEE